ncbi:Dyp-type peroxidase [Rheinheimera texasensis]|uniref:Dyp-type peroxidase n=1 Tax=Rheinheimera texasensis TaxID=306205 RepID=UPI0004E1BF7D|nr:Dyp-type peroxidase [Rheinheimera texasensis]
MAREQVGVCAEPNLHGLLLLMNALDGHESAVRHVLGSIPGLIHKLAEQFSEANLNAIVAIGSGYWHSLYPHARPADFQPFSPLSVDDLAMPAIPYDVLLKIRADRYDVLHLAIQQCYQLLMPHLELVEQTHCFRFMDGRDLTGFIDQPLPPRGRKKRELALINENQQPEFAQGSYLFYQRYRLDLNRWQQLTQAQQEAIIGQRKLDGQQLPTAQLHEHSHAVKAAVMDAFGQYYPLVFQNMPYGQLKSQGLVILACSADPSAYLAWLSRRLGDAAGQNYDLLLDYVQADSGAAFFAPSVSFLEDCATL